MDQETVNKYLKAGEIHKKAMKLARSLCIEGALLEKVCDQVEEFILKEGGKLAFPVQISLNEIAAHYCPSFGDKTCLKKGDLVKIDIGVHVDGYIADAATSLSIGKELENEKLIRAAEDARDAGIEKIKAEITVSEVGAEIQKAANKYNLKPIVNLTGHGLGVYEIHTYPSIPNYDNGSPTLIEEGAMAIEPFITNGAGYVIDGKGGEIFALISNKGSLRIGKEILDFIRSEYKTCPFARRWLIKKFGSIKVNLVIRQLVAGKILHEFADLRDQKGGKVAQAEHTVLVLKDKKIVTTR